MRQQLSPGLIVVIVIVVLAVIVGIGYAVLGKKSQKSAADKGQTVDPNQMQRFMQEGKEMQGGQAPQPAPVPQ